jgi:two-component system chemotaxis sensor kinase CheA
MTSEAVLQMFFEEAADLVADCERTLLRLEQTSGDPELVNRVLRNVHSLKGTSSMLRFEHIAGLAHALEDVMVRVRKAQQTVTRPLAGTLLRSMDVLRGLLHAAREGGVAATAEVETILAALRAHTGSAANSPEAPAAETEPREAAQSSEAATLRVPIEKVDSLVNLVGELVITQSMIARLVADLGPDAGSPLVEAVTHMDRHTRELQERVMAVRMLPIRTLFGRFPRLVRDLALTLGKHVVLETAGEDTELDKGVMEQITDPLTHLVRNAIDHGIEMPGERRAAGKSEVGSVRLRAYQEGGSIHVEVADDGRGLDRERIVAKARQLGVAASGDGADDDEVFRLIFRPGFSTAETVTDLSGRGVGLDVVHRNVEALRGAIAVRTERGRGTTFKITLPLTVAVLDAQPLRVGTQTYIVPLASIVESIRPRPGDVHRLLGSRETLVIRDQVLPLIRLHQLFQVRPDAEDPTRGIVVIGEHGDQLVALLVDELLGQQQMVIKSLETNFQKVAGVAGATILSDGNVALILDVSGLMALSRSRTGRPMPAGTTHSAREDAR